MKKIVSIEKKIDFPSMIGEITSISLEHDLQVVSDSEIEGEFKVYGTYKLTEASRLEDNFNYVLPVDILLNEKLEEDTIKITIDDFSYEIENDEVMVCQIKIKIEGVEKIVEEEVINSDRECDGDKTEEKEIEIPTMNSDVKKDASTLEEEEIMEDNVVDDNDADIEEENISTSIFSSLNDSEDAFKTYSVYIIREGESIDNVLSKYKITREELEAYNDLKNIDSGSKIIIPTENE